MLKIPRNKRKRKHDCVRQPQIYKWIETSLQPEQLVHTFTAQTRESRSHQPSSEQNMLIAFVFRPTISPAYSNYFSSFSCRRQTGDDRRVSLSLLYIRSQNGQLSRWLSQSDRASLFLQRGKQARHGEWPRRLVVTSGTGIVYRYQLGHLTEGQHARISLFTSASSCLSNSPISLLHVLRFRNGCKMQLDANDYCLLALKNKSLVIFKSKLCVFCWWVWPEFSEVWNRTSQCLNMTNTFFFFNVQLQDHCINQLIWGAWSTSTNSKPLLICNNCYEFVLLDKIQWELHFSSLLVWINSSTFKITSPFKCRQRSCFV